MGPRWPPVAPGATDRANKNQYREPSWALLGPSWAILGRSWADLGGSWARSGRFWTPTETSRPPQSTPGEAQERPRPTSEQNIILVVFQRFWAHLDPKKPYVGPQWRAKPPQNQEKLSSRASLSTLGAILGPSWAMLGRSWRLLGRSWGGLGAILAPKGGGVITQREASDSSPSDGPSSPPPRTPLPLNPCGCFLGYTDRSGNARAFRNLSGASWGAAGTEL